MLLLKLTLICMLAFAPPVSASRAQCRGRSLHVAVRMSGDDVAEYCHERKFMEGKLTDDGCRIDCQDWRVHRSQSFDREDSLACCLTGQNKVGSCYNGRCQPAGTRRQASDSSDYKRFGINIKEFIVTLYPGSPPPEKLKLKVEYVKPRADRRGSYENGDIVCESYDMLARSVSNRKFIVPFDLVCSSMDVHKDSSIKFVVQDDREFHPMIFTGVLPVRLIHSGFVTLESRAGSSSVIFLPEEETNSGTDED